MLFGRALYCIPSVTPPVVVPVQYISTKNNIIIHVQYNTQGVHNVLL